MGEQDRSDHATNVTETDANITAVGDIVDDQTPHPLSPDIVDRLRSEHYHIDRDGFDCISCEAADEIERLQSQVRKQALELLVAHSEALGLYDLTTLPKKEAT
jgi:HAMP domain-containing protein